MANLARCSEHGYYMSPGCPWCAVAREEREADEARRAAAPPKVYTPGEMMDPAEWVAPEDYGD